MSIKNKYTIFIILLLLFAKKKKKIIRISLPNGVVQVAG